jgi:hypothetical protein
MSRSRQRSKIAAIRVPHTRGAYEIIRALVDEGRDPDPVSVLATGKTPTRHGRAEPRTGAHPERHHRLAVHLADLYTHAASPAAAPSLTSDVLDEAYRNAFRASGIRMQQLADIGAAPADLTMEFASIANELADLRRQAQAVADCCGIARKRD